MGPPVSGIGMGGRPRLDSANLPGAHNREQELPSYVVLSTTSRTKFRISKPMSKVRSHAAVIAAVLFLVVAQLQSQDEPQLHTRQTPPTEAQHAPTFSANVKVVNLLATVRDKHGAVVSNLGKDDFKLEEDGRAQTIKYFTRDTDLPLTIGLLVDTSLSQRRVIDQERSASFKFLQDVLRDTKDNAFVIHFDHETELLQDLTDSRDKLVSGARRTQNAGSPVPENQRARSRPGTPALRRHRSLRRSLPQL